MGSKLSSANTYMRDPGVRKASVLRSVATSSAIEGIRAPFKTDSGKPFKADSGKFVKGNSRVITARRHAKR